MKKMNFEKKIARFFKLSDENWMKHSNPWSVYTRFSVLPIITLAFWSRIWIGWWCLVPGILSILWMYFNPVFFPSPKSTRNWASKSAFGERVYINRYEIDIPKHHKNGIQNRLNLVSFIGLVITIWAIITYSVWGAFFGVSLTIIGKSWYLDRMVWLYEDMKFASKEYQSWDF